MIMQSPNNLDNLLYSYLRNSPFLGLGNSALLAAAKDINLDEGMLGVIAPYGTISLIDYWFSLADNAMEAALIANPKLKIREKATLAIKTRLEFLGNNKEALRGALAILALPQNITRASQIGYRAAHTAWCAMGDASTDFNFYTKRATLLATDAATGLYYLNDDSIDNIDTWNFLDRRIENIMGIEKAKAEIRKFTAKFPNPLPFISKLRYGQKPLP